jgi:hypothetical protein
MMRFRYVARVRSSTVDAGLSDAVVVTVTDPDSAAEAVAMAGQDEPSREERR